MNLVPDSPGRSPNYWCTWGAQHPQWRLDTEEAFKAFKLKGTEVEYAMRRRMDQAALFEELGWATRYWPQLRSELYSCLDDGWDVPYEVNAHQERWRFGSLILDEKRFPDFKGTPAERLRRLNDKMKSLGWRGLALWVASQCEGDDRDGQFISAEACEAYWRERARWSAEAGIEYWKVDWGARNGDLSFRRMLTRVAREEAPGLVVEHAYCMMPVNNVKGNGRFGDWPEFLKPSTEILSFSDVFRRYDVMGSGLGNASALDRIGEWLQHVRMEPTAAGIINCEDDAYVGAALGGSLGILRVPDRKPCTKMQWPRIDEVGRALRWQRVAPAFGIGGVDAYVSPQVLTDSKLVADDYWYRDIAGTVVKQYAPAIITRGVALPTVICDGEPPYVVASRHPNGATAVATAERCLRGELQQPRADITLDVDDIKHPAGVFGLYGKLTLHCRELPAAVRVWAQDLLGHTAQDITRRVQRAGNSLTLDGALIDEIGRAAATADDPSDPGLILKVERV